MQLSRRSPDTMYQRRRFPFVRIFAKDLMGQLHREIRIRTLITQFIIANNWKQLNKLWCIHARSLCRAVVFFCRIGTCHWPPLCVVGPATSSRWPAETAAGLEQGTRAPERLQSGDTSGGLCLPQSCRHTLSVCANNWPMTGCCIRCRNVWRCHPHLHGGLWKLIAFGL